MPITIIIYPLVTFNITPWSSNAALGSNVGSVSHPYSINIWWLRNETQWSLMSRITLLKMRVVESDLLSLSTNCLPLNPLSASHWNSVITFKKISSYINASFSSGLQSSRAETYSQGWKWTYIKLTSPLNILETRKWCHCNADFRAELLFMYSSVVWI